jgi:glucoamylase
MPRSLILGNGNILVGLDAFGQVRDFYFPYVWLENHVGGRYVHRLGVWADDRLHWFNDGSWDISITCKEDTFLGELKAVNKDIGVSVVCNDIVYNEKNIFVRKVSVTNVRDQRRQIKFFFNHEFEIYESHKGDTAYFDPIHYSIVHYKGRRVFLVNARADGVPFDDYSVGVFNIEGKEGTHKDAEDGMLSKNSIEHGPTDSVIGVTLTLDARAEQTIYYWMAAAESVREAQDLNDYVLKKGPDHLIKTTTDFWHAWVNKYNFSFYGLSDAVVSLFRRSLFYLRAHADNHGAIIASSDSDMFQGGKDTYGYMWPRDASYGAMALGKSGDPNVAQRFFEFCNEEITDEGYLMHKYRPDKSLGSSWHPWIQNGKIQLPIQEDETALVIIALWQHYELTHDIEFIESIYNGFIERAANFLMGYRDFRTGLPKPSYDLWEERLGIHTFTAAAVYGGLIAAARFADVLGKTRVGYNYRHTAQEIKESILRHTWDPIEGMFYRMVKIEEGKVIPDMTLDVSSVYGIFSFGVLDPYDEKLSRAFAKVEKDLAINTRIGGLARYKGDHYYQVDGNTPGNPWFIPVLWVSDYYVAIAKREKDLAIVKKQLDWVANHALKSGVLGEQMDPHTGAPVSAAPLSWSHAQFVITVINYLNKLEELGICVACNPVR